jgi:hypothetical protein
MALADKSGLLTALSRVPRREANQEAVKHFVDLLDTEITGAGTTPSGTVFPGDTGVDVLAGYQNVFTSVPLTAPHQWALPFASDFGVGKSVLLSDIAGRVSVANWIVIVRRGTDTINGLTQIVLTAPFSAVRLVSDGATHWTVSASNYPLIAVAGSWVNSINPFGQQTLLAVPAPTTPTITTDDLVTEPGAGDAVAGDLGEYYDSGTVTGISLASGTSEDVLNHTFAAGDWDISGFVGCKGTSTSTFYGAMRGSLSTAGNTHSAFDYLDRVSVTPASGINLGLSFMRFVVPTQRFSLASATLIHLVVTVEFTVGMNGEGRMTARRMR